MMVNKKMIKEMNTRELLEMTVNCHSEITDGVLYYDCQNDEFYAVALTSNTILETDDVEVLRLPQGEAGEIDCRCWEFADVCPYTTDYGVFDENIIIDGKCRKECCMETAAYDDEYFSHEVFL